MGALVVTRREGERVKIGDDIYIWVCGHRGNQYKVAIEAPKNVVVLREELVGTEPREPR